MRKVRAVVEIMVPDDHRLTDKRFATIVKNRLNAGLHPHDYNRIHLGEHDWRKIAVKQFRRVHAYMPAGKRYVG